MSALKDIYNLSFFNNFSDAVEKHYPKFNRKNFIKAIFVAEWNEMELMHRMKHTAIVLHQFFPADYKLAATLLTKITAQLQQQHTTENIFGYIFLPHYIETFGIDDFETSVKAMEAITQFVSCEYAVRPFIIKYNAPMLQQMLTWSKHKNHHVRRLASEGLRPRLPWAMALPQYKKNPKPVLPLLENLKADESEYVRRSVANHLNDIAKDNPEIVIAIAKKWKGRRKETDDIVKHGCRTLLKQGHPEVLQLYSLNNSKKITVSNFKIQSANIKIGDGLDFSFAICNNESTAQAIRVEYGIYYLRQNGQHNKKVFKIAEREIQPKEQINFTKSQSFKIITTRAFYKGHQKLSIIVNGKEKALALFELR